MEIRIKPEHLPSGLSPWHQWGWDPCCYNLSFSDHFAYETRNLQAGLGRRGFAWRNASPLRAVA
jgi:hypothetical protein